MANKVKVLVAIDINCRCSEGYLQHFKKGENGEEDQPEIRAPRVHNCQYIRDRESLHKEAGALAYQKKIHFFDAMDVLYRERFGG